LDNTSDILIVDRPKFYGTYVYSMSLSCDILDWHEYFAIKEELQNLVGVPGIISGSKHLLTYYIFFNDSKLLSNILDFAKNKNLLIHNIKKISEEFLHVTLKRKKYNKKGDWYGEYSYRIRLKRPYFDFSDINDKLQGKVTLSQNNPALFYMSNLNDVILFKLLYSSYILEMHDSQTVRG